MTSLKAPQIVTNINSITSKSQNLHSPANSITIINASLLPIGQGPIPQVIMGLGDIVSTATLNAGQLQAIENSIAITTLLLLIMGRQGTQPFTAKSDEDSIRDAWKNFVTVQKQLLNILIGKAGILPSNTFFLGPPVTQSLQMLEGAVDTYALGLINICPDDAAEITDQQKSFDEIVDKAITAYSNA